MHESARGRKKQKAAEWLKEQLNVEPDPISATGADDAHSTVTQFRNWRQRWPTADTQVLYTHIYTGTYKAAQPVRGEHFIYSQSQNKNEAGCFLISAVLLCILWETEAPDPSASHSAGTDLALHTKDHCANDTDKYRLVCARADGRLGEIIYQRKRVWGQALDTEGRQSEWLCVYACVLRPMCGQRPDTNIGSKNKRLTESKRRRGRD